MTRTTSSVRPGQASRFVSVGWKSSLPTTRKTTSSVISHALQCRLVPALSRGTRATQTDLPPVDQGRQIRFRATTEDHLWRRRNCPFLQLGIDQHLARGEGPHDANPERDDFVGHTESPVGHGTRADAGSRYRADVLDCRASHAGTHSQHRSSRAPHREAEVRSDHVPRPGNRSGPHAFEFEVTGVEEDGGAPPELQLTGYQTFLAQFVEACAHITNSEVIHETNAKYFSSALVQPHP